MARDDIVWAMPPNPQRSNCLARNYLLHLALWHGRKNLGFEGDCRAWGKHAKLWLQHDGVASFGMGVEQLVVSSYSLNCSIPLRNPRQRPDTCKMDINWQHWATVRKQVIAQAELFA
eukprot:5953166-Amphidinium_carterae.1